MPRPETPIDPSAGPVERFAHDLRQLRKAAGNPSYRKMSSAAHFSGTTLSEAARGKRSPSLAVTLAYVQACGGDAEEWRQRWLAMEGSHAVTAGQETLGSVRARDASPASLAPRKRVPTREVPTRAVAMAVSAGAVGGILVVAGVALAFAPLRTSLQGRPYDPVHVLEAVGRS